MSKEKEIEIKDVLKYPDSLQVMFNVGQLKEFQKNIIEKLLEELNNEFEPDVRMDVIFPANLEEWINNKLKSINK